jgi:hypothetical protein
MRVMTLIDQLLTVSDTYCTAVERSRSRVSTLIFGDGGRLDGLANGKDLNTRSLERALDWFAANWPEGTVWPEGVARPVPVAEVQP